MYQPLILTHGHDKYYEISPHRSLKNLIQTFWVSPVGDTFNRILPDFCGDIILVLSKKLTIEKIFFSTPQTKYFIYDGNQHHITVGVRFYSQGFPLILSHPLSGQKNHSLLNVEYFSDFSAYINTCGQFSNLSSLIAGLNDYFLHRLKSIKPLVSETLLNNFIVNVFDGLSYAEAIGKEVISERSIQRKFKKEIALSPYELYDTIRLQKILREIQNGKRSFVDLTYAYHFYDQAHFSRTIRKFSGLSPKQILSTCRNYTRNS